VLYLVITKRLFGIRGGKKSYDARLRGESVLEAARRAADCEPRPAAPDGEPPDSPEARDSAAASGQSPNPGARDPAARSAPPDAATHDPAAAAARGQSPDLTASNPATARSAPPDAATHDPATARSAPPDAATHDPATAAARGQSPDLTASNPATARSRPPETDPARGEPVKRRSLPDSGPGYTTFHGSGTGISAKMGRRRVPGP